MSVAGQRMVTLLHHFGGKREGLTAILVKEGGKGQASKVLVSWPLSGEMVFNARTGREHKKPRAPWRLSKEDVEAFCEMAGTKPIPPKPLPALKGRGGKVPDKDSAMDRKNKRRQLSWVGE